MTYTAGLDAFSIVWIAKTFAEEHRAALDWLNRITDKNINFFSIEVEVIQIGDSLPAPQFNVVAKPNDWTKFVMNNYVNLNCQNPCNTIKDTMEQIPILEYKGYRAVITLNSNDNRLWGKICTPENPSTPIDGWEFAGDNIQEAEKFFRYQVEKMISHKEFSEKCHEWKSKTDYESIRCVMNILPDEFKQRVTENKFDVTLLDTVKGGNYEVPLYYATKAWDIILKGELYPIDYMIGPEEEEDCTEADIQEFLSEAKATRTRCEACMDNNKMKKLWNELFNIDIDTLDIDFLQFNMHLPPIVTDEEYQDYFMDVPEGIDEWILGGINHPNSECITHDEVSALMEFTAEVLLRRKGEL